MSAGNGPKRMLELAKQETARKLKEAEVMSAEMKTDTCVCGATIYLVPTGKHAKWVTNPNKPETWHCRTDRNFPVRSHAPRPAGPRTYDMPQFEEVTDPDTLAKAAAIMATQRMRTSYTLQEAQLYHGIITEAMEKAKHEVANVPKNEPQWARAANRYDELRIAWQILEIEGAAVWGRGWWDIS